MPIAALAAGPTCSRSSASRTLTGETSRSGDRRHGSCSITSAHACTATAVGSAEWRPTTRARSQESASRTGSDRESYRDGRRILTTFEVPVRREPRRVDGVGDDDDRGGPAGVVHPVARHELADGAELVREPPHPGSQVWSRITARTAASVTSTAPAGCDPDGFATGTADADVNTVTPNGGRPAGKRPGSAPAGRAVELPRASEAGASEVLRLRGATSAVVTPGGSGGPPANVDEFVALGQPGLAAGVGRRS